MKKLHLQMMSHENIKHFGRLDASVPVYSIPFDIVYRTSLNFLFQQKMAGPHLQISH